MNDAVQESLQQFLASFSYGSRHDHNFKFLEKFSPEEGGVFIQELLHRLGDSVDDGDVSRLTELFFEYQKLAYAGRSRWVYEDGPFTELEKPVSEIRIALVTSSGHFVDGDDPKPFGVEDMTQEEAEARLSEFLALEPTISQIPVDTPYSKLRVRHCGYDIRTAQADPNVVFPVSRMKEMAEIGRIGSLAPVAYSFVGGCAQNPLIRQAAPQWAKMLQMDGVEGVVLVPV